MAEAVALIFSGLLLVAALATIAGLSVWRRRELARLRREAEASKPLPASERHRLLWEKTGDPGQLEAMKEALEKEEGN